MSPLGSCKVRCSVFRPRVAGRQLSPEQWLRLRGNKTPTQDCLPETAGWDTHWVVDVPVILSPIEANNNKSLVFPLQSIHCAGLTGWCAAVSRVSVQGVKSLGGHFACLCRGFEIYEVKNYYHFSKRKWKYFYTFNHFYSEKSSKRAK